MATIFILDNDSLFTITSLLVPYLTTTEILHLRATCRATRLALRDIVLTWEPKFQAEWGMFPNPRDDRDLTQQLVGYIHPRVAAQVLMFGVDFTGYLDCRIDLLNNLCAVFHFSAISDPCSRFINYFAQVFDYLGGRAFLCILEHCGGGLPMLAYWSILRACRRRRQIDLLSANCATRLPSGREFAFVLLDPDLLWNRFAFMGDFEEDRYGMRREIQRELTARFIEDADIPQEYRNRTYVLAYPYTTRAQGLFLVAEYNGRTKHLSIMRTWISRRVAKNIDCITTPTLFEQFREILRQFGWGVKDSFDGAPGTTWDDAFEVECQFDYAIATIQRQLTE